MTSVRNYKARQHRRAVATELGHARVGFRVEKVLVLFMDSGIIWCAIGVRQPSILLGFAAETRQGILVIAIIMNALNPDTSLIDNNFMSRFASAMQEGIIGSGLVQLIVRQ